MSEAVPVTLERVERVFRSPKKFDASMDVELMDGYVKGSYGEVMIELSSKRNQRLSSGWQSVSGLSTSRTNTLLRVLCPVLNMW